MFLEGPVWLLPAGGVGGGPGAGSSSLGTRLPLSPEKVPEAVRPALLAAFLPEASTSTQGSLASLKEGRLGDRRPGPYITCAWGVSRAARLLLTSALNLVRGHRLLSIGCREAQSRTRPCQWTDREQQIRFRGPRTRIGN